MSDQRWMKEFPAAITLCSRDGTIIAMNEKAVNTFQADGGRALIGRNVLDCHPEPAKTKLKSLLDGEKRNVYTIEKNGIKKLIYQSPWYDGGVYAGLVEISFEIPFDIPHFFRK